MRELNRTGIVGRCQFVGDRRHVRNGDATVGAPLGLGFVLLLEFVCTVPTDIAVWRDDPLPVVTVRDIEGVESILIWQIAVSK